MTNMIISVIKLGNKRKLYTQNDTIKYKRVVTVLLLSAIIYNNRSIDKLIGFSRIFWAAACQRDRVFFCRVVHQVYMLINVKDNILMNSKSSIVWIILIAHKVWWKRKQHSCEIHNWEGIEMKAHAKFDKLIKFLCPKIGNLRVIYSTTINKE